MLQSNNPYSNELIKEYPEMSSSEIDEIIKSADITFNNWKNVGFNERAKLMKNAAAVLNDKKNQLAKLMTLEMGKPILQSYAEVEKCAWVSEYYSENAEQFLSDEIIETDASKSFVCYKPLGVVLAVMPWNFPLWQVFRFAAPSLMAGNAGILKHSSNVSGCALAIEDIFKEAGFPDNLFRSILVKSSKMDKVIEHPLIRAVTLTGSVPAGRSVAAKAGAMLKKNSFRTWWQRSIFNTC